jgi:D-alanyl-D-alanine carboxypeptidase
LNSSDKSASLETNALTSADKSISNSVSAKVAAIIIDYDTKKVLFEINADTLNYPASLTKMMTLYITFDYLDKKKIFCVLLRNFC